MVVQEWFLVGDGPRMVLVGDGPRVVFVCVVQEWFSVGGGPRMVFDWFRGRVLNYFT